MYLYAQPHGGFNDMLVQIQLCINYCHRFSRILLLDTYHSVCYKELNFSDYFKIKTPVKIIYDHDEILKIITDNPSFKIYPNCLQDIMQDIVMGNFIIKYPYIDTNNIKLTLIPNIMKEHIIVYASCGGGNGTQLFSKLTINDEIIEYCKLKYFNMPKPYISLQIRNTDYKCNYKILYDQNINLFNKHIYIATDDKLALEYFKSKNINVYNFCTFPENKYGTLHYSKINTDTKIKDLLVDLLIVSMSDNLISNSKGGFINLLKKCHKNKNLIKNMFML